MDIMYIYPTLLQFVEDEFEPRRKDTHLDHLDSIEDNHLESREYGVNHRSALMDLKYLDIRSGALFSDVMHDLLEGVLQYEIKLMLIQLIEKQFITLENVNRQIDLLELPFGTDSDRPAVILRKHLYSQGSRLNQKGDVIEYAYTELQWIHACLFELGLNIVSHACK